MNHPTASRLSLAATALACVVCGVLCAGAGGLFALALIAALR